MNRPLELHHFHWRWEQDGIGLRHSHPEAVFHVIDTHHPDREPRVITAYANEKRAFVRCTMTGRLHEHFELDHPSSHERLARYELHHLPTPPMPQLRRALG
jgi:hypothetical protein